MLEMIGVGPFITIPLMLASMNGPQAMLGWLLGAIVAVCDGFVWAELGAAMPGSGGPYRYLSEAYGPRRLGRFMSFLFIWETIFSAIVDRFGSDGLHAVCTLSLDRYVVGRRETGCDDRVPPHYGAALSRHTIDRTAVDVMWVVVIGTAGWISVSGLINMAARRAFESPAGAFRLSPNLFFGLGSAALIAM